MRRADRLLQILHLLRGRRRTTAAQLAEWLEISTRTVYRDMADLLGSGAPVSGEAGEGYWLEQGFTPPPLSFSAEELAALEVGARMLAGWADPATAEAAAGALAKIHAVLGSAGLTPAPLFVPQHHDYPCERLSSLRDAILHRQAVAMTYQDEQGQHSQRCVLPLGLFFWGDRWTLAAWSLLRQDYRHFRIDRLQQWHTTTADWPSAISLDGFMQAAQAGTVSRQQLLRTTSQSWHR